LARAVGPSSGAGRGAALAAVIVAGAAFLPFLRGALRGQSLFFRDLAVHFLPLRRFALEGLRAGEVRFFNPLVHEGVPLSLPAVGYPLDLVALLRPDEAFLSLVLALHVPLAALAFFVLARGLGLGVPAAAGGSLVYALGGFLLSCVNLYVHLQAAAWAPLLVLALVRTAQGGGGLTLAAAAGALAVSLSTTGVEIVGQAVLVGLTLGLRERAALRGSVLARLGLVLALGVAAAAPVLVLVAGQVPGSARAQGFPVDVVLAHSVHPFTLVQSVVAGLYGNTANLANEWWGANFFPLGFPYVLSLYLGLGTLVLAGTGALSGHPLARRLVVLAGLGLVASLGRWAGLEPLVEWVSAARAFRFPVKAFFTVHLTVAVLVALGLDVLGRDEGRRRWPRTALAAGGLGALLALAPFLDRLFAAAMTTFARAFLPPGYPAPLRAAVLDRVLADAATGGVIALVLAALGVGVARRVLAPSRAAVLAGALVAADLLRAGAGLNPMVSARFFAPSPELQARLPALRAGRVFTCSLEGAAAYHAARAGRPADHVALSFAASLEALTPAFNVPLGVPTALSPDLTMLVPAARILPPDEASCRDLGAIVPRLRAAGVHTVLSLDPLAHADLEPDGSWAPTRIAPLVLHAYRLRGPLPHVELLNAGGAVSLREAGAGRLLVFVEAERPGTLRVREGWSPGWTAHVGGEPAPVAAVDGRHLAVEVPAGPSEVALRFEPRGLRSALVVSAFAVLGLAVLAGAGLRGRPQRGAGR
jgi:hypothetical protein